MSKVHEIIMAGDQFEIVTSIACEGLGWSHRVDAIEIEDVGCLVRTRSQSKNPDGSYSFATAMEFVPGVCLETNGSGNRLVQL